MTDILIVDDSALLRKCLRQLIEADPTMRVVGQAGSGEEALAFLENRSVHVVTMDIQMPGLDGFETTRRIMERHPVPVVIVSSCWEPVEVEKTFQAMDAGAVAILPKPANLAEGHDAYGLELRGALAAASQARVIRKRSRRSQAVAVPLKGESRPSIVAVGASTGGPQALVELLGALPVSFPLPLLVVQHIARGFLRGFREWLEKVTPLEVVIAGDGGRPRPGRVYLAPEGRHLALTADRALTLSDAPPEHAVRPSASVLFRSLARVWKGDGAAVLLSGMGTDGAEELRQLHALGAATFAQDRESSVVWGMPGEAVRLGGARYVLPPVQIAETLEKMTASLSPPP